MQEELLSQLRRITPEEEKILAGQRDIDRALYMTKTDVIDARKMLDAGKWIQVRPHTRFVHFPRHTHNYIEVFYMCTGSTHHVVEGEDVIVNQGELLFLNQRASQEIYPAGENDIGVNFIILPEFFRYSLQMMSNEANLLRNFLVNCLKGEEGGAAYLHFKVSDILPVQNLVENMIWSILNKQPNKRSINQATMDLLFLQLMNYMDKMELDEKSSDSKLIFSVLSYIEGHYREGELTQLAEDLHYDLYWLSREIKKKTGKTYTELVQTKRLTQAAYLLASTHMSVVDVAMAVGYDNASYFHRLFQKKYQMTPRLYRLSRKDQEK